MHASGGSAARTKEEELEHLVNTIQKNVDKFDPEEGQATSEYAKGDQTLTSKIMFSYTDFSDNYSYYLGYFGSLAAGAMLPFSLSMFGEAM